MKKKFIAVLLALSLVLSLCACGQTEQVNNRQAASSASSENVQAEQNAAEDSDDAAMITDGAGRSLKIRPDAAEATIASVYFVAVPFLVALDLEDRVLAVNTRNSFWTSADPALALAGSVGKGTVDLEKLASYGPTALVHRSNDPQTVEAVERLGVDVVCITVENADDIISTLELLGNYFGVPENAERAAVWFKNKMDFIEGITADISESERKTAILIGGEPGRAAGADMLQSWMIKKAGGIPVVEEVKDHNWVDIGVERVFSYNPEYIFCTSSSARSYDVEDLLADSAWSAMTAVENNNVYDIPTKLDSWDMPGISCVLGIMYMLHKMYPERFSVSDLEDEVDDYYRFMFGRCFDQELELDWDHFE